MTDFQPDTEENDSGDHPAFGLVPEWFIENLIRDSGEWRQWHQPYHVPNRFAHLHDEVAVARWWQRVLALVRDPVRIEASTHGRRLHILGCSIANVAPDGQIHFQAWEGDKIWSPRLLPLLDVDVVLQGFPYRMRWLQRLGRLAALEVQRWLERDGRPVDVELTQAYAALIFEQFERRLPRNVDLRQMRERIARAIGWERELLTWAARVPRVDVLPSVVTVSAYNLVLRQRKALEQLQREASALIPIYLAFCEREDFPEVGEAQQRLRAWMTRSVGLRPALWRQLRQFGSRALLPLTQFYSGGVPDAALEHLRLINGWGMSTLPPLWAVQTLLADRGDPANRWPTYTDDLVADRHPWAPLMRLADRTAHGPHRRSEFALIVRWMYRDPRMLPLDPGQFRAGWHRLLARAQAWLADEETVAHLSEIDWLPPFELIEEGVFSLVPISSGIELWREAIAMNHCIDQHLKCCQSGNMRVLSLRRLDKRVATVEIFNEGSQWHVRQAKGRFNQSPAPVHLAVLHRLLALAPPHVSSEAEVPIASKRVDQESEDGLEVLDADDTVPSRVVAWIHAREEDRECTYVELRRNLRAWLEEQNDQTALNYNFGGTFIELTQRENWQYDLDHWLDRAEEGEWIPKRRIAAARRRGEDELRVGDYEPLSRHFIEATLRSNSVDADVYANWEVEKLMGADGRIAWAVYTVIGYSFTTVKLSLLGVIKELEDVASLLDEKGYWLRPAGWD